MIVLDTAALIVWLSGQRNLSAVACDAIDGALARGEIAISVMSVLDVAQYVDEGRLELTVNIRNWLSTLASTEGVRVIPVDCAIAVRAATLPSELTARQKIIAATAIALDGALVTSDVRLREFGYVETIW